MVENHKNYSIFNLSINSDLKLEGFCCNTHSTDVVLREDMSLQKISNSESYQQLSLFDSRIENRDLIAAIKPNSVHYKFLRDIKDHVKQAKVLHQTLPSVLFQRNLFTLHGSAFIYNNQGIVICGPSTFGKSETVFKLSKTLDKFKILTDDIVGIETKGDDLQILPGLTFTSIRAGKKHLPLHDSRNRYLEIFDEDVISRESFKLNKIILLGWGETFLFKKITNKTALKELMVNSYRPVPSSHCDQSEMSYFKNLSSLVKNTEVYFFTRKMGEIEESISFLRKYL